MRRATVFLIAVILLLYITISASADGTINFLNCIGGDIAILKGSVTALGDAITVRADARIGYQFDHWEYQELVDGQLVTKTTTDNPVCFENYARAVRAVFVSETAQATEQQPQQQVPHVPQIDQSYIPEQQMTEQVQYQGQGPAQYPNQYSVQYPQQQYQYPQQQYQYPQQQTQGSVVQVVPPQPGSVSSGSGTATMSVPQTGTAAYQMQTSVGQRPYAADPAVKYTITYKPDIYSTGPTMSTEWNYGEAVLAGQMYQRKGYTQTGWSLSGSPSKAYNLYQKIPITHHMILYPYWEAVSMPLYLTVNYAGNGAVRLAGGLINNGWTGKLDPGQSYTFTLAPYNGYYAYSISFAGWYQTIQNGNQFTVSYEMMQGKNQTLNVRYESIYHSPKTGDDSNITLWAMMAAVSIIWCATLLTIRRSKQ